MSDWTVDTLKEFLVSLIDERDKRYEQRFNEHEKSNTSGFNAAKEAVLKAEAATEKRFEGVNEFRATLADQQHTLMPRAEVELSIKAINDKLTLLSGYDTKQTGEKVGVKMGWSWAVAILALAAAVFAFLER